jgi:hypothetical protein
LFILNTLPECISKDRKIVANGPAIKSVCVAERMKAGAEKPDQKIVPAPAGRSEAWRGFWRHGTNYRAYTSVAVQVK